MKYNWENIELNILPAFTRNQIANFDSPSNVHTTLPALVRRVSAGDTCTWTPSRTASPPPLTCGANGDRVQAFVGAANGTRSRHPQWDPQEQNGRSVATPIHRRRLSEVRPSVANASDRTPAVRAAAEKPWGNRIAANRPPTSPRKAPAPLRKSIATPIWTSRHALKMPRVSYCD